ncbi:hypothetical protein PPTG_22675 [Phytophthora nicotianae INRA-310]|uniref:Uncharacterized protein n=1 Tax=Phytophthora nicotianae (strain INRA-310) TaxID=761204 RepID=W2QCS3_PHYN3|nr:hypothetical protein PPTG_22675 [Phytophthora nicotianae INRA-310]ETN10676.1 hypothetical protein PPTG_22675 [Phytophthora nicotianae INRA-310]
MWDLWQVSLISPRGTFHYVATLGGHLPDGAD